MTSAKSVTPTELPFGVAISDTEPVGVPVPFLAATATLTFTACPCVRLTGERLTSVVALGEKLALFHAVIRFAAFTEPKPVARS